jgi:hypothetical protein
MPMTADIPEKSPRPSKDGSASVRAKREARLAEQLRANLKRRKAAARRHKEGAKEGDVTPSADDEA